MCKAGLGSMRPAGCGLDKLGKALFQSSWTYQIWCPPSGRFNKVVHTKHAHGPTELWACHGYGFQCVKVPIAATSYPCMQRSAKAQGSWASSSAPLPGARWQWPVSSQPRTPPDSGFTQRPHLSVEPEVFSQPRVPEHARVWAGGCGSGREWPKITTSTGDSVRGQIISPEGRAQSRSIPSPTRSDQMERCLVQAQLICKGDFFKSVPHLAFPRLRGFHFIYTWIRLLVSVFCGASLRI